MPTAQAAQANTTVICSNGTDQRSYQIGWDNSNIFFADKGYIPAYYCTGGYAYSYNIYVSDTLNGGPLGYYQGVVPVVVEPTPVAPSDTSTATSETQTATVDTSTSTAETQTSTVDTSTSSSDTTTTTSQQETPTATPQQEDSSTVPSDTSTVETVTVAPVDGSTATSQPAPPPIPQPIPVLEPTPEPEPVVQPEVDPTPEPTPEPETQVEEELPEQVEEPVDPVVETPEPPIVDEEETITLDNGVVLTEQQAVAIALIQDPVALVQELFTNPAAAFAALGQVGADMSPEVREKSEKVVISAIIAGNIATQAAATAGAAATYRRKP